MNVNPALAQFIDDADTMDFIVKQSEFLIAYLQNNPDVVLTQSLEGRFVVGYVNRNKTRDIIGYMGPAFITAVPTLCGLLDLKSLEASGIIQVQKQPYLNLNGKGVLMGFVDTGIDYTRESFVYENGTSKIQYIYDQTVRGNTPDGFYFGTEYTNSQINEALKAPNPYQVVPQTDMVGHGTFLASVAAGTDEGNGVIGAAPGAELIIVKLKKANEEYIRQGAIPPDQENVFGSIDIMIGIEYILKKARELGRPVVICLGVGSNQGSHDGYSIFEQYLTGIATLSGVCVCTAAGNESQAKHHVENILTETGEEKNIDIIAGENAGTILVSLWNTAADRFSVSIRSPTGEVTGRIPARSGTLFETTLVLEKARIDVEYFFPVETTGGQLTIVRIHDITPGIWTIVVHGDIVLDGVYHAWLQLTGLISPNVGFLEPSPYTTTVVPATAFGIITCGAYNSNTYSLYLNSSWGPTRAAILKPDLAAPGVNVGGVYPTGNGVMSGTSVAAAITAGASALLLQWGVVNGNEISMSTYHVRAYLIRGCSRLKTIFYPNQQWGYGSLNLLETFDLMREV